MLTNTYHNTKSVGASFVRQTFCFVPEVTNEVLKV